MTFVTLALKSTMLFTDARSIAGIASIPSRSTMATVSRKGGLAYEADMV